MTKTTKSLITEAALLGARGLLREERTSIIQVAAIDGDLSTMAPEDRIDLNHVDYVLSNIDSALAE